jgi:pimeloyl-ACP methyl ester carboxylesterase
VIIGQRPRRFGAVVRDGQRIAWQEFGAGVEVVLLLPTWSIVHSDFWRHQVAFLARTRRVIVFDGLGNGESGRPSDPQLYGDLLFAGDAIAVLDACAVERAIVLSSSQGGAWHLALAADHPERVAASVFIAPNLPLAPGHPERVAANATFGDALAEHPGWARWNRRFWLEHFPDFLRFFFTQCFTEPNSQEQIEHFMQMGLHTTPAVLLATAGTPEHNLDEDRARQYARRLGDRALVIHGSDDAITPVARGRELARISGAELVIMSGSGHEPHCRVPEETNRIIEAFLQSTLR